MKTLVIIDGNNQLHRAYHKQKGLRSPDGRESGAIYGFSTILASYMKKYRPTACICIFDGGRSKHRLNILPDYKGGRVQNLDFDKESFYEQRDDILELLKALNIYTIHKRGEEADDYMYLISKKYNKQFENIIIISNDKDFHQLISNRVSIFSPKDNRLLTKFNYESTKGYKPRQVVDYLILDGDKSDNIPGYKGFGEKTIMKFLDKHKSIKDYLSSDEQFGKLDKDVLTELYWRNKALIDIRFFIKKFGIELEDGDIIEPKGYIDYATISELSDKYGIKTFFKSEFVNAFKKIQSGVL